MAVDRNTPSETRYVLESLTSEEFLSTPLGPVHDASMATLSVTDDGKLMLQDNVTIRWLKN